MSTIHSTEDSVAIAYENINVFKVPLSERSNPADDSEEAPQIQLSIGQQHEEFVLKSKLDEALAELESTKMILSKHDENLNCFRQQRDSAIEERNSLMNIISRLNGEMEYLKDIHSKNAIQLKNAISSNCDIITKNGELKTKELSLKYREELLEQERNILNERIQSLTMELNKANLKLETADINYTSKISSLEIHLATKTRELEIADDDIVFLRNERIKFVQKVEELSQKLVEQRESHNEICNDLQKKLNAKNKIADLYKSMRDDSNLKCEELTSGVTELQKLLNEAVEKYGELESRNMQVEVEHDTLIQQKNDEINSLKVELSTVKDELTKMKAMHSPLGMYNSPTVSAVRDFVKSGKSLTEIYSELVYANDQLIKKNEENVQLKESLEAILNELETNAPYLRTCRSQYDEVVNSNSVMTQQMESIEMEYNQLREDYAESVKLVNHHEREKNKLREEMNDLNQQVCFLLKEMEISRGHNVNNSLYNNVDDSKSTSSMLISNNLVTFSNIQELQSNNQKLLKLVRELTEKQEEMEIFKEQIESGELQKQMEILTNKVADLQGTNERQMKQLKSLIKQRDMYKKLCHDKSNIDVTMNESNEKMEESSVEKAEERANEVKLLESQLEDAKKQINQQKEDHKKYEEYSDSKEKMLLGQIDKLRQDLYNLNENYRKSSCTLETNAQKSKILQDNLMDQKQLVQKLYKANQKSEAKVAEYETSFKLLKDKLSKYEDKIIQTETMLKNLEKECRFLRDSNKTLLSEKDRLNKEMQEINALLNNLEVIKDMFENKNSTDKTRLENKLEEFSRECSMLQSKLQENSVMLKSNLQINVNKATYENLCSKVCNLEKELENKDEYIAELKKNRLGEHYDALNEKIKELNSILNDRELELKHLQEQVTEHKNHEIQLIGISESAERELKTLNDKYVDYKSRCDIEISNLQQLNGVLTERCRELEVELSLQSNNQEEANKDLRTELTEAQERIDSLVNDLNAKTNSLDEANIKILELADDLKIINEQNAHNDEMFNQNVQIISSLKKEIDELRNEMMEVRSINVDMEKNLNESKLNLEKCKADMEQERAVLMNQLDDSSKQNSLLLDRLEELSSQFVMSSNQSQADISCNTSLNESGTTAAISGEESKSVSKSAQIIIYLRKERDLQCAKFNAMQEENLNIKSELKNAEKTINELRNKNVEVASSGNVIKHSDVVKKLEMFNMISNNNTLLREERDNLLVRVNELSANMNKLEESLSSLQETNNELNKKVSSLMIENSSIQADCNRWKSRFNLMSEKLNRTNPDEWKRLQNERETLAKMLSSGQDNLKKANDEILLKKLEKSKLEEQINILTKKHQALNEEIKKYVNENNNLKKEFNQLSFELNAAKTTITEKTDENTKINESVNSHLAKIKELQDKEMQVRRIAKRFKTQYEELLKSVEEEKSKSSQQSTDGSSVDDNITKDQRLIDVENIYTNKISELETKISTLNNNNNSLQSEIDTLRTKSQEMEERAMQRLLESKTKIMYLTESKESLMKKLSEANSKIDTFEQTKDEHDDKLVALKSQFEGRMVKLEKEKNQMQADQQNEVQQLNKHIETLMQKISSMQKQIDNQQPKPSMSSNQGDKPAVDPPTANIKPMSGTPQPIGSRRSAGETPLASIKPMTSVSGVRTAAVLPNAQYSMASPLHHISLHSTGASSDPISSMPSSSHVIEHLPSSSSISGRHPVHSPYSLSESAQDTDTDTIEKSEVSNAALVSLPQSGTPQTVALVTPRMEASSIDSSVTNLQQTSSTNTVLSSTVSTSHANPNASSEEQTLDQAAVKRPRAEVEQEPKLQTKKQKIEPSTTECESEYQVPTSSQRDQEDDSVIVVDSDDEEEENEFEDYREKAGEEDEEEEEEDEDDEDEDDDEIDNEHLEEEEQCEEAMEEEDAMPEEIGEYEESDREEDSDKGEEIDENMDRLNEEEQEEEDGQENDTHPDEEQYDENKEQNLGEEQSDDYMRIDEGNAAAAALQAMAEEEDVS